MVGQIEARKTQPTIQVAQALASALGIALSDLIRRAEHEAGFEPTAISDLQRRAANPSHCVNEQALRAITGLGCESLVRAISYAYETLDIIDEQLATHSGPVIANLVELANLSSMVGNLLGAGLAEASGGLYVRNRPHAYPDLVPQRSPAVDLEVKVALEKNRPKGHLPKAGNYITFRYVLANDHGSYRQGKANRGKRVFFWEAKVGALTQADFDLSNTPGDSGKTAVIKTKVFDAMPTVYQVPELIPYSRKRPNV